MPHIRKTRYMENRFRMSSRYFCTALSTQGRAYAADDKLKVIVWLTSHSWLYSNTPYLTVPQLYLTRWRCEVLILRNIQVFLTLTWHLNINKCRGVLLPQLHPLCAFGNTRRYQCLRKPWHYTYVLIKKLVIFNTRHWHELTVRATFWKKNWT